MRRGEMVSTTTVTIILVAIGFGLILFIWSQVNWTGNIDKEACHQSVILRAAAPLGREYVPLRCKTEKICVGGECDGFENAKVVRDVKVDNKEDIEKLISEEIVGCWNMMGEGKISLFSDNLASDYGIGKISSSCIICSRIAFNEENLEKKGIGKDELKKINVLEYMFTHKVPGKDVSYINYIVGDSPARINPAEVVSITKESGEVETVQLKSVPSDFNEDDELAIMFMQISSKKGGLELLKRDLGVAGKGILVSFVFSPKLTLAAIGTRARVIFSNPVTSFLAGVFGFGIQQAMVWNNQNIAAGVCGDVESRNEGKDGCSVVRLVKYDVDGIKGFCKNIESIV